MYNILKPINEINFDLCEKVEWGLVRIEFIFASKLLSIDCGQIINIIKEVKSNIFEMYQKISKFRDFFINLVMARTFDLLDDFVSLLLKIIFDWLLWVHKNLE